MAIYTRYAKVLDASGTPVGVREALALINQTLDEVLSEQEGDFDAETRWALTWFEQHGFAEGDFGVAETLSKAKNTSIEGLVERRHPGEQARQGAAAAPGELPADWDPATDSGLTMWEMRASPGAGAGAAAASRRRLRCWRSWAGRPMPRASCATASTPSASAKGARARRSTTMRLSRAGRRSRVWPTSAPDDNQCQIHSR
jgi:hypothetical protein